MVDSRVNSVGMSVIPRAGDGDDKFPVGMPILLVVHNATCLRVLTGQLRSCEYHVTPTKEADEAMQLLRGNKDKFALVIIDADMPDMDGFKLLEFVEKEIGLPVIILSSCGDIEQVKKGIELGACYYLLKPVPMDQMKNIWQHVFRRNCLDRRRESTSNKTRHRHEEDVGCNINSGKRRKDSNSGENEEEEEEEGTKTQKKTRVVWTTDLHSKFVKAVDELGLDKAVPNKILALMKDPRVNRASVGSHLQKYRQHMKKLARLNANMLEPIGGTRDSAYGGTPDRVVTVPNAGPIKQHCVNAYGSHSFGLSVPSSGTMAWDQTNTPMSTVNPYSHMLHQISLSSQFRNMSLDPLTNARDYFPESHVNAGTYSGAFGNNVDNIHDRALCHQMFINQPNEEVSFQSSASHALPDTKTTYFLSQTPPLSHVASDNVLQQQTFFHGGPSGVMLANGLSYEGDEFHKIDEVNNSDLGNPLWRLEHGN